MNNEPDDKKLYIVRHGKSSWDYPGIGDIDRPLIERGVTSSYRMARTFFGKNPPPDILITSPAIRTLHTAIIFGRTLEMSSSLIRIENSIYMGTDGELLELIYKLDDTLQAVMVFGHNPCLTDFSNRFLTDKIDNLPTSGMVSLCFHIMKWKELSRGNLTREEFDYPKKHT